MITYAHLMSELSREQMIDQLTEHEMIYITLDDCIRLAKQQLTSDLQDYTTEKLATQYSMVFDR